MTYDDSKSNNARLMDEAAEKAKKEYLSSIRNEGTPGDVEQWWGRWYLSAGHKRLGRILLEARTL